MGAYNVVEKEVRDITLFRIERTRRGISQRALAAELGMSPASYARIEEGVYGISGVINNPKVQAVADYFDIDVEIADEEAHKNLVSGWHPATVTLMVHNGSRKGSTSTRSRGVNTPTIPTDLSREQPSIDDETDTADVTKLPRDTQWIDEWIDDMFDANYMCAPDVSRADIANKIFELLYGKVSFDRFMSVCDLVNKLVES